MKIKRTENWRVLVHPDNDTEAEARRIAKDINRHIDGLNGVAVYCDHVTECSFCKRGWEEDHDGCPICCEAAVAEWEAA